MKLDEMTVQEMYDCIRGAKWGVDKKLNIFSYDLFTCFSQDRLIPDGELVEYNKLAFLFEAGKVTVSGSDSDILHFLSHHKISLENLQDVLDGLRKDLYRLESYRIR
jgi:hypothetical protein